MTILIFDRSNGNLRELQDILEKLLPDAIVTCFSEEEGIISFAGKHIFNVVFINISDKSGEDMLLGKKLLSVIPRVNLIFISEGERYILKALRLHASGYIRAPLTGQKVQSELDNLLYPVPDVLPVIRVDYGDGINISVNDKPVRFKYEKTKELFKVLLDMKGAMITTGSIKERLWGEDSPPDRAGSYLQNLRSDLLHTFASFGLEGTVCHRRGRMWLDTTRFNEEESF